jgi:hypothetical protein
MTESRGEVAESAAIAPVAREPARTRIALAIEVCCARPTLWRTTPRSPGVVLTGINEGDSLVHGDVSAATEVKMGFNFGVPFVVSNLGVLAGTRRG